MGKGLTQGRHTVSQSGKEAEGQWQSQQQGSGWGRQGQGLPPEAVPDPSLVGGDFQEDGWGLAFLAACAPARHSHQVPRALQRADQGFARCVLQGGVEGGSEKGPGRPGKA